MTILQLFPLAKEEMSDPATLSRGLKRFPQESPPYTAPISPKLPRAESHPSEGTMRFTEGDPLIAEYELYLVQRTILTGIQNNTFTLKIFSPFYVLL